MMTSAASRIRTNSPPGHPEVQGPGDGSDCSGQKAKQEQHQEMGSRTLQSDALIQKPGQSPDRPPRATVELAGHRICAKAPAL